MTFSHLLVVNKPPAPSSTDNLANDRRGEEEEERERERERERESFIREEGREPPWISEKEPEREIKRDGLVHYNQIRTS